MKSKITESDFKGIGIRDRALLFKLIYNLQKVTNILGKIYERNPEGTQKALATIVATILLKPYDDKKELSEVLKKIKSSLEERMT